MSIGEVRPARAATHPSLSTRRSSFSDFAQKNGKDERFKGIEKMRDREGLFNEFILEVRRREKDEKNQKKETVSGILLFRQSFAF